MHTHTQSQSLNWNSCSSALDSVHFLDPCFRSITLGSRNIKGKVPCFVNRFQNLLPTKSCYFAPMTNFDTVRNQRRVDTTERFITRYHNITGCTQRRQWEFTSHLKPKLQINEYIINENLLILNLNLQLKKMQKGQQKMPRSISDFEMSDMFWGSNTPSYHKVMDELFFSFSLW